ncbi:MAG: hypothetical protein IPN70_03320 [Candidatus Moraniibacteriota bacterium]|nr:MAG: hypothetical protein IPN70_03320 [Candidatus Moranbacteria bacterium]
MGLNDLERKFSKEDFEAKEELRRSSQYNVDDSLKENSLRNEEEDIKHDESVLLADERENQSKKKRKKILLLAFLGIACIGSIAIGSVLFGVYRKISFNEKKVILTIEGPQEVSAGLDVAYRIFLKNENGISLKNTSLVVQFPSGFEPKANIFTTRESAQKGTISIGNLSPGESFSSEIKGKFAGSEGDVLYMDFFAKYETGRENGQFEKRSQLSTILQDSSVSLDIVGILEVTPGEKSEYQINYSNNTKNAIYNAQIVTDVSQGFHFEKAEPETAKENISQLIWNLGTLNPGDSGTVRMWGAYYQEAGSKGVIASKLGYVQGDGSFFAFTAKEATTVITTSLLSTSLSVGVAGNIVSVGQEVPLSITYANTGDIALPSGIVQLVFEGDIWDYDKLAIEKGNWNKETRTITWRASDIPELKDLSLGETGKINFSIPVRNYFEITGTKDRNFFSTLRVVADSPDALSRLGLKNVAGRAEQIVKMQTFVGIDVEITQASTGTPFNQVRFRKDEEVVYNVKLRLENPYNDVTNGKFSLFIPSVSEWNNFVSGTETEAVTYDERRRKIEWDLGMIRAGTGVYENAREIVFSIRFMPRAYQENSKIILLSEKSFTGKDVYVEKNIDFTLDDSEIYMGIF